jgi:hypothetical protein
MKKYVNPFRVTSLLLVLYCLGHTFGALVATPSFGDASDAVVHAMKTVHMQANGSDCTWWGFYLGFGYFDSIFFLFSAVLTWFLGGMSLADQRRWAPISWALCVSYVLAIVLSVRYFFLPPTVFSTAIALLLGIQSWRLSRVTA